MSAASNAPAAPLGRRPWLVFAALAVHVLEEAPRFPEWATRHFGTTSPTFFLVSHVPILAAVAWSSWRASRPDASERELAFLLLIVVALAGNAAFHAGATLHFREYSPGLVSALALYLPLAAFLVPRIVGRLGRRRALFSAIAGVVVSALAVASLWIDMPRWE